MNPRSISVVIPNFNGRSLLEENLPSVRHALQTSGIVSWEIIVPDDASTDSSVAFLQQQYPDIQVILSEINRGFAGNTNRGIFAARHDLVMVLNSDVVLTEGYFAPLLAYFDDPETFGVAGRIIGLHDDTVQDSAKVAAISLLRINPTRNQLPAPGQQRVPTLFMSGANALIDRQKLVALGGYAELFNPYYFEDADLGLQAWRRGWTCWYEHRAICRHPNSATISKSAKPLHIRQISYRNRAFLHTLHLPEAAWLAWLVLTLLKWAGKGLAGDNAFAGGHRQFFRMLNACRTLRREREQAAPLISVYAVKKRIEGLWEAGQLR